MERERDAEEVAEAERQVGVGGGWGEKAVLGGGILIIRGLLQGLLRPAWP